MDATVDFLKAVTTGENFISPMVVREQLKITEEELDAALGLSCGSVSSDAKAHGPKVQRRLRDMAEIINRVIPRTGSELAAFLWYRSQPLPSFGGQTAGDLVRTGRGEAVKTYLSRITVGGYA